jgi:plastocyanin
MPSVFTVIIGPNGYHGDGPDTAVSIGDSVWWLNEDARPHSATSDDGTSFDTGELNQGQSARVVMNLKAGTIAYHDKYGPSRGSLLVR